VVEEDRGWRRVMLVAVGGKYFVVPVSGATKREKEITPFILGSVISGNEKVTKLHYVFDQ